MARLKQVILRVTLGAFILSTATEAIIANGGGYGGRRPVMGATIIPTQRHTVAAITAVTVITMERLTMTPARELTVKQTAYRPDVRNRGAAYNPYTGAYARGASVSTPYGTETRHRPITRIPAPMLRPRQGSNPNAQWGSSYVSRGNKSATMGHYSTANGTVAGISGSQGGEAVGAAPPGVTAPPVKRPAAICTPGAMATFVRTPVTARRIRQRKLEFRE